jgi:hypothetical protein
VCDLGFIVFSSLKKKKNAFSPVRVDRAKPLKCEREERYFKAWNISKNSSPQMLSWETIRTLITLNQDSNYKDKIKNQEEEL